MEEACNLDAVLVYNLYGTKVKMNALPPQTNRLSTKIFQWSEIGAAMFFRMMINQVAIAWIYIHGSYIGHTLYRVGPPCEVASSLK